MRLFGVAPPAVVTQNISSKKFFANTVFGPFNNPREAFWVLAKLNALLAELAKETKEEEE